MMWMSGWSGQPESEERDGAPMAWHEGLLRPE
jgi:hypothetical protein